MNSTANNPMMQCINVMDVKITATSGSRKHTESQQNTCGDDVKWRWFQNV